MSGGFDRPRFLWSLITASSTCSCSRRSSSWSLFSFNGVTSLQGSTGSRSQWYESSQRQSCASR